MTNAQSKYLPVTIPCNQYVHPWTENCWNSAAGQILHSLGNSAKIYTVVYTLSLLMRGRIPTARDLQHTFLGIIQSTGFLVTNGCSYLIFSCILRNLLGAFHFWTIAYTPAFIASFLAILVERPTRRPLLCLYVANLATETIWRMAVARNLVYPIQYGETLIFGFSTSILLYLYKKGLHKSLAKDSLFNVMKFVVGHDEEGKLNANDNDGNDDGIIDINAQQQNRSRRLSNSNNSRDARDDNDDADDDNDIYADADDGNNEINRNRVDRNYIEIEQEQPHYNDAQERELHYNIDGIPRLYDNINYGDNDNDGGGDDGHRIRQQREQQQPTSQNYSTNAVHKFKFISNLVQIYGNFLKIIKTMPRHKSCPHSSSCILYSIRGGLKLFGVGVSLQVALKLVLQIKKIIQFKLKFRKTIFNEGTLKLGLFLGGFSFLYKASSCVLRHSFGKDDPLFAIPAGLISSIAFTKYPDVTIALYVMWKMLQITYNMGIKKGYLPEVPGFTIFLYCASTATLFHAAALEAEALRPSYWKFLSSNSGGRVNLMDRRAFDVFGLNSQQQAIAIQKLTNTANSKVNFALN